MKYFVSTLAVFILSHAAFAATELSQVKEITVSSDAQLTTWVDQNDKSGIANVSTANYVGGSSVECSLGADGMKLNQFSVVKQEPVEPGMRLYLSPKAPITLKVQSLTSATFPEQPMCNGEPEMCDTNSYTVRMETVVLTDGNSNKWELSCLSNTPDVPVTIDDIKIKGVEAK